MGSFAGEMRRVGRVYRRQMREARMNAVQTPSNQGAGIAAVAITGALALIGVAHLGGQAVAATKAAQGSSGAPGSGGTPGPGSSGAPGAVPSTPAATATSGAPTPTSPMTSPTPSPTPSPATSPTPATTSPTTSPTPVTATPPAPLPAPQVSVTGGSIIGTPTVPASSAYAATDIVTDPTALQIFEICTTIMYSVWVAAQNPTPTPINITLASLTSWLQNTYGQSATPPLRSDGSLDWRTWSVAAGAVVADPVYTQSQTFISEFGQTPNQIISSPLGQQVTDPGIIGLAQNACLILPTNSQTAQALKLPATLPAGSAFGGVVAAAQTIVGEPVANGVLDYWTLGVLVGLAYVTI
jgi:hypothetical protein